LGSQWYMYCRRSHNERRNLSPGLEQTHKSGGVKPVTVEQVLLLFFD
jgi:hypothetical protein